ncbi:ADAM 17-like protease [Neodiprion pinetum]|uniref:ADAM 17-like protease n=1 Tax=Neodiprion lecontei TaxID=441921 RepID=A0A6J0C5L3_NEOLC|nr:ADAM 17-like protease [Neodiprion lecontei]XP_046435738.1 ADAM 17-like protease [Neodiprion fabricii]XP_046466935.1 ADAM 17-like protease [Neodiprion pinetum]
MKPRDLLLTILLILHNICNTCSLHDNLKYYETLHASHFQHKIVKRGAQHSYHPFNKINEVEFYTHGRNFRLFLTPRREVIHSNFKAYEVNEDGEETTVHVDHENFYHGRVFGEVDSYAHVHVDDGMLTATITVPDDDTYHIEPSWRHLPHADNRSMIVYKGSNVKLSWEHYEGGEGHTHGVPKTCGYVKEDAGADGTDEEDDKELENEISTQVVHAYNRTKRQTDTYEYTPTKTRCPLLLVADYRFYQEMGASNTKTTINYLISLIDRVHKIYNDTLWQERQEQDGFKGMGFVIKKIVVHSEPTRMRGGEIHYNMVREKWDVRTLLEVFSREYSHKDFCLAHLFTDLKFEGGILGLAYVGSPRRNSVGGICTPEYFKNGYTLYLNSGLSSSRNHYGQRVITREADLVTAHEFGHNWGSEHDPDITECSPSASQGGSYLMYTYSVSGYDVNNKRFSPCSLRSIRKVLQAKSGRCFSEPEESFCGNLRVEGDEECDAGLLGTEDNDSCCDKNCKLRRNEGAVCSDKNSPCCQNCAFMPVAIKCRDAQYATCEQESRCTGASSECPRSPPMNDGTGCLERGQCRHGKCIPYCETQGLQSCMCDTILDACKRCCRMSLNETCFPVDPQDILPDGTPCIQGFCNKGICEKTIQDVVERFWDIIEDININKVMRFLKDNIVGAVIICTAIVWIPASCVVSYVDRRRIKEAEKKWRWKHTDELIHPEDQRRIVHTQGSSRQRIQPT